MSTPPPDLYIAPTDWLIDKIQKELDGEQRKKLISKERQLANVLKSKLKSVTNWPRRIIITTVFFTVIPQKSMPMACG